ncbi:MAG: ABC transporter permease [Desulfobulbaceae bacterium DB1]|nr:MAG: ABC transporter permease [Desulfobulbaceae bacterium DB1]
MIPPYPDSAELGLAMRDLLHPLFQQLPDGISEFTFANIYLFRAAHGYRIARLADGTILLSGSDTGNPFFMLPFGLPETHTLRALFAAFGMMKCVSDSQATRLKEMGYNISEDRDNFDYLYLRRDLAELTGGKFHSKRNLIKAFLSNYSYEGKPLLAEYMPDALRILEEWRQGRDDAGDYLAAREGLERAEELQLCGGIYYVDDRPVAYSLGEELMRGRSFAIHFEKAVAEYKGLWQFVNQAFASILPEHYETVNREQDLGNPGLRQAKLSYKPVDFVKKYRAFVP